MRTAVLLLISILLLSACRKSKHEIKSATQLLTQKPWLLSLAGFDDNNNGVVDASENTVSECQAGNIYTFNIAGTGTIEDTGTVCQPPASSTFTWQLQGSVLSLSLQPSAVLQLDETTLSISPDLPLETRFIMVYKH
ncbi:MAG TPA: lipocalin family protein [Chitinophagaceae bacterium]|nr:lipocalin family protein [Chitinophagaceae bacterium]